MRAPPGRARRPAPAIRRFVGELYEKAASDNLFFLASGLTFDAVLAAIPFLLLVLSVAGILLAPEFGQAQSLVRARLWELIPVTDPAVRAAVQRWIEDAVARSGSVGLVSGVLFVWFSTRLFGSLRAVLGEVFDLRDDRGVVKGKLADAGMVIVSTVLLTVNVAVSALLTQLGSRVVDSLGLHFGAVDSALGWMAAFFFLFVMYLLIFKFVPARRLRWRTAALAAALAAVAFEALKVGFGWFLTNYADYSTVFFASATVVVAFIALYYGAATFILSGEIAQLVERRRVMLLQREVFE